MSSAASSGPDSQDFMESFRRGDREAFKKMLDEVCGSLFAFVEGIVKDRDKADKIVSECFYKLFYKRESMSSVEEIRRWLFVAARRLCLDHLSGKAADVSGDED